MRHLRSKLVCNYRLPRVMSSDGNRDTMLYLVEATRVVSQTTRVAARSAFNRVFVRVTYGGTMSCDCKFRNRTVN